MYIWHGLFLLTYFTIQLIFTTIYESHCTISMNFYLYLLYFQQKIFSFNKISEHFIILLLFKKQKTWIHVAMLILMNTYMWNYTTNYTFHHKLSKCTISILNYNSYYTLHRAINNAVILDNPLEKTQFPLFSIA